MTTQNPLIPPLEQQIISWAKNRKLFESATVYSQLSKLHEEIGEWLSEVNANNKLKEKMELGDIYVVLTNLVYSRGFGSFESCGQLAYDKIKNRSGHMENGSFVKDNKTD